MDSTLPVKSKGIVDNGDGTVTLYGRHATSYSAWRAIKQEGFKSSGCGAWGDGVYAALPDAKHTMSFYSNWSSSGECVHLWIQATVRKSDIHWIPTYDEYIADLNAVYDEKGFGAYATTQRTWETANTVVVGFDNNDGSRADMVGQWRCPAELVQVVKVETPARGYNYDNETIDYAAEMRDIVARVPDTYNASVHSIVRAMGGK